MTFRFGQTLPAMLGQFGVDEHGVARENWFPKLHIVRAHEITDPAGCLGQFEQQQAGHLRHRFHLHHAGHHRMTRKMPRKKWLVDRH